MVYICIHVKRMYFLSSFTYMYIYSCDICVFHVIVGVYIYADNPSRDRPVMYMYNHVT